MFEDPEADLAPLSARFGIDLPDEAPDRVPR